MGVRGTGLKKDTHTVKASNPGEQPANPEVSAKPNLETYLLFCQEFAAFFEILRRTSFFFEEQRELRSNRRDDVEICVSLIWDVTHRVTK